MIHPLVDDISSLKDTEIEEKIRDLTKKYFMVHNQSVQHQLLLILDIYKNELGKRQAKAWQDMYQKRNSDLDNLINVS